ncbi:MAG: barstar family protein [Chloroflexi bacterium]|nr:barstar family protein [Chloroflexota bacterium]
MSDALDRLLAGEVAPDVYRYGSRANAAGIVERAEEAGWRCVVLPGRDIGSKAALLNALSQALSFPDWVGHNWDALLDALRDQSWAPAQRGYLLIWERAGRLAWAEPETFATALAVLRDAVAYWRGTATPFAVLVRGPGCAWRTLPRLA